MNKLPTEIIQRVYDYLGYGQHCMINKEIYQTTRTKAIHQFYRYYGCSSSETSISDLDCEHCSSDIIDIQWYHQYGWYHDEEGEPATRLMQNRKKTVCKTCLCLGLIEMYKKTYTDYYYIYGGGIWHGRLPRMHGEGQELYDTIMCLREKMKHTEYLALISQPWFQEFTRLDFSLQEMPRAANLYDTFEYTQNPCYFVSFHMTPEYDKIVQPYWLYLNELCWRDMENKKKCKVR